MGAIKTSYKAILTIAGSDSGGCAGIQADIKSISACGGFAASVITATTAQNTMGVFDIHPIPNLHIEKQLDAVLSDLNITVVKVGMLHSTEVINTVKEKLASYQIKNIIIDPVMVATSGDKLITDDAIVSLKGFLSKATLITPNMAEAALLLGRKIDIIDQEALAMEIGKTYKTSVLLKGKRLDDKATDITDVLYVFDTDKTVSITNPFIDTNNTHGTGCSLSSSIATFLSFDNNLESAVKKGCKYVNTAILQGKNKLLGKGNGPVNHFNLN